MKKQFVFLFFSFSRLWKNEFRAFVTRVIGILDQFDPLTLNLGFVYDRLVEAQAELSRLKVAYGKHPLTEVISDMRLKRKKLIEALVAQIRTLHKTNTVYSIPQLEVISPFVARYLNPISNVNSTVQDDVLDEMFGKLEGNTALQAAVEATNLRTYFDELKALHRGLAQAVRERSDTLERQEVATNEVRAVADKALRNLMSEIELAQLKYPGLDYNPLIDKLNELIRHYMAKARTRETIRKQAASGKVSTINKTTTAQNGNSDAVAS